MDETPKSEIDKETIFNNPKGLETYSYSFYDILPSISNGYKKDAMCDYGAVTSFDSFLREGAYSAEVATGWASGDWDELRNLNYFIENCVSDQVEESVRNNYIG